MGIRNRKCTSKCSCWKKYSLLLHVRFEPSIQILVKNKIFHHKTSTYRIQSRNEFLLFCFVQSIEQNLWIEFIETSHFYE